MATSKVKYIGSLRTTATHLKSGETIVTDAPVDNNGKGEAFSPSDLVATSLANCMITIMGMAANTHKIDLGEVEAEVTKVMATEPRRVSEIYVNFDFPNKLAYTDKEKKILENAAMTCPVFYSLHPDIKKEVQFNW
ncbi:OsmC family protein [Pseudopedobacter saltans DSM 12145]|uniref:OsmC family protein n=1 Tax=Pseudopedobacter saltans (strain ATCC 51119 / DSM 12145 / JCM 21818 / CCUG 39354 / LMG 10337 / NBRC 100064 / NCIMB 13643) TaxID=762903 RepID=F0S709_PSESL|nr:OsmC family protein [Pseudopedobacter saltans]ADY53272.1 OsmC family protein [Pseudopedobacter saltans DSM 12145]